MEFPRELCQAELPALPSPRSGIRRVGGAARPLRLPPLREQLTRRTRAAPQSRSAGFITREGAEPPALSAPTQAPVGGNWAPSAGARAKPARQACLFAANGAGGPRPREPFTPRAGVEAVEGRWRRRARVGRVRC